jgi:C4-dicarboxylate-specific signal transduction histidine kinase
MPIGFEAEALRLRTALRDLVALSTVPAVWVGREPRAIAAGLVDVLVNALYLDFAFVRLCDLNGGAAVEIARGSAGQAFPEWLQQYLSVNGRLSRSEIVRDAGGGAQRGRGIVIPVGVDAEGGLVAAACDRAGFPSEIDQLLLSVAANQAATAFRMARLLHDHRFAEEAVRERERLLRSAHDELETKVAERTAELQRSEAYLAEAQRLSHTGSFGWDISNGKLYWSEETFRIVECDRADQPTIDLVLQRTHPHDRARVQQTLDRAAQEGTPLDFEHRLLMPDGSVKYVHVVGRASKEDESGTPEFVGAITDITERKRAEAEARESERRYREMQMELEHANRVATMGQLTASIAHEVNQPIATARNNAASALRFLSRSPPDLEEVREALGCIVNDVDRAGDVIGGIRKLIQKAPAPRGDRLDINEAIREVIVLTRGEALKAGVAVQMRLAEGLPLVQGDRVQLQQVLLNLILNAVEAMSSVDGARRELSISTERRGAEEVLVAVRDSGPGTDPEHRERVFDSFYTTKPSGMGLGLSICRSIVDAHRGRLWADANEPRGAVFQFTLPAANRPQSAVSSA